MTPDQLARVRGHVEGFLYPEYPLRGEVKVVLDRLDSLEAFVGLVREYRETDTAFRQKCPYIEDAEFENLKHQEQAVDAALAELAKGGG